MENLVIISKNYGYSFTGATISTQKYVELWSENFDNIIVLTMHVSDYYKKDNIKIQQCSSLIDIICKLKKNIDAYNNIIGYSDDHFGFLFKINKIPYVHTYHGNWPDAVHISLKYKIKSIYFIFLYAITIKNAYAVVNVSRYMKKFTDLFNKNEFVIRNGIDKKQYKCNHLHKNTCLMVGNVDKRKYNYCVKLASLLKKRKSMIRIHIYGRIIDKSIKNELEKLSNIELKGSCRNIPYKEYKIFLCLSTIENLPVSICEAILEGVPVVSFYVGGISEVVVNDKTGYTIENFDLNKVIEKIEYIFKYGFVVDKSILRDFSWELSAKKYYSIFKKVRKMK